MPQHLPRQSTSVLFSIHHQGAVDEDIINTFGVLVRVIFKRVSMREQVCSAVMDTLQVENHHIRPGTRTKYAPIPQSETLGGEGGHLADGLLQSEHGLLTHITL